MQLEVYQTDAEAFEAAAADTAARLAATPGPLAIAVPGGRGGRGLMLALAARGEIPWGRVRVFFTDECCAPAGDPRRTAHVAAESLIAPRGIAADRVYPIGVDGRSPADAAAAYAALLATVLGEPPVFDVVLLDLGARGEVGALTPGSDATNGDGAVAAVAADAMVVEPRVARVTLMPTVWRAARHVVVTAVGADRAAALAAALREPVDAGRRPAQAVLPSATASWFVDRSAAALLLRDARPGDAAGQ